ncbi:MAG: hypothetical protein HZB16_00565 [Armatimonadetes bacterium]|nr:hypothetical protein [Armatimonadota bacterium]
MRLMPGQANTPTPDDSRRRVDQRLSALRGQVPPSGDRGAERTAASRLPRLLWPSLGLVLLLLGVIAAVGWHDLKAPPPAIARGRLASGVPVRLVAVTRGAQQTYRYDPRGGLCARLLSALGVTRADRAVVNDAPVPADSITLWLWIGGTYLGPRNGAAFGDETRREYRNGPLVQPVLTGQQVWPGSRRRGSCSLGWVSLTSYDHTARKFAAVIPVGPPGSAEPGAGEVVHFTVQGPGQAPTPIEAGSEFPVVAGDASADLQLWQLRRVTLPVLRSLLPLGPVPEPADQLVLADVDVVEKAAKDKPGRWFLQVLSAATDHGEKLLPARQRNGLAFLSNGRRTEGLDALAVRARAVKVASGGMMLKFRQLEVPAERGQTKEWNVAAQAEPFPGGRFIVRRAMRASERGVRVEIEGHGPRDSECSLAFVDALDQTARHLKLSGDTSAAPAEATNDAQGCHWRWMLDLTVAPDTKWMGLACNLDYRATMADSHAELKGRIERPRAAAEQAAWGVMVEPRGEPVPKLIVIGLQPGSRAASGPLRPGDELVRVDSLPPSMVSRALMRHQPSDQMAVTWVRDGQTFTAPVGLDAAR